MTALVSWTVAPLIPGLVVLWRPMGDFGTAINTQGLITSVESGSAAAQAGVTAGDRIDFDAMAARYQRDAYYGMSYAPGVTSVWMVQHRGKTSAVKLRSRPFIPFSNFARFTRILRFIAGCLFAGLGGLLVLLRPSKLTWAFFLYGISANTGSVLAFLLMLPASISFVWAMAFNMLQGVGFAAFAIFALRFPSDEVSGWRRSAEFAAIIAAVPMTLIEAYTSGFVATSALFDRLFFGMSLALYLLAVCAFASNFLRARGAERERLRWVVAGCAVGFPAVLSAYFLNNTGLAWPLWLQDVVFLLTTLIPITVAYAVIRHRVIDVRFVLNRSIMYAGLAAAVVGVFALIDLAFTKILAATQVEIALDIAAALAVGFWLRGTQQRIVNVVDRMLFRSHYDARQRLLHVDDSTRRAQSHAAIARLLTEGAAGSLGLASAALFEAVEDGGFVRDSGVGWPEESTWHILPEEPVVQELRAKPRLLQLDRIRWTRPNLPPPPAQPELALPIFAGGEIAAIAFYSAHASGSALDPDEINALKDLTVSAGIAYGRLHSAGGQFRMIER